MMGHFRDGEGSKGGRFGVGRGSLLFCFCSRCQKNRHPSGDGKLVAGCTILAESRGKVWVGGKISRVFIK